MQKKTFSNKQMGQKLECMWKREVFFKTKDNKVCMETERDRDQRIKGGGKLNIVVIIENVIL